MLRRTIDFKNYQQLKKISLSYGADLFGVADISKEKEGFELSGELKDKIQSAVSLGVGLSAAVLSEISQAPTKLYFHHYRTANMFLDQLAFRVSRWIQKKGFLAIPIPASQILDWQRQTAHISHKRIAHLSGIGWIGRNNLLVSKELGAQLRLVTILTDMPLEICSPLKNGCGPCSACVSVCPAGAIQEDHGLFKHLVCFEKLKNFQKQGLAGQYICGVCVKACAGRKK